MTMPTVDQTPAATRTNRFALVLLGLLLLAAGVLGLVASFGGFGAEAQRSPFLDPTTRDFAASYDWFWLAVAVAALIAAVLALLWLRAQFSTSRVRSLPLESDRSRGATTLKISALERACVDELESHRGIGRANAVLVGDAYRQTLILSVSMDGRETVRAVDEMVRSEVLPKIRQALDDTTLSVRVEYKLATRPTRAPG